MLKLSAYVSYTDDFVFLFAFHLLWVKCFSITKQNTVYMQLIPQNGHSNKISSSMSSFLLRSGREESLRPKLRRWATCR